MYFAKHISSGRCVDAIMYVHFSSFESESNSAKCNLLLEDKLVLLGLYKIPNFIK